MSSGPFNLYAAAKLNMLEGNFTLGSDTLVATLLTASYTPSLSTDATWANMSSYETSGTGYTSGGVALTGVALTYCLNATTTYGNVEATAIASGGSAYTQSDVGKTVTVSGGTETTAATVTITQVNGGSGTGAVTGISVAGGGVYTAPPTNPASTTGGGTTGSGLTINGGWGVQLSANNPSWSSATITAQYCVILQRAGSSLASTDKALAVCNLNPGGGAVSSTNGAFTVQLNSGASSGNLLTLA